MASPQAENGHIDIANELAEALSRIRISGEEYQILWVILRKTYGWHKKQDAISLSQFVEMTGIDKPHVIRAIKNLLPKKVITVANNGNEVAKVYGINKDYEKWVALPKKATLPKKAIKVANNGNASLPILGTTKETTTKEKKERAVFSYSDDFQKLFSSYPKGRAGSKSEAWIEWEKKRKKGVLPPLDDLLAAIETQKRWRENKRPGQFIEEWKNCCRWIKHKVWEIEVEVKDASPFG